MNEYSNETANKVDEQMEKWINEFKEDELYFKLSRDAKRNVNFVLEVLGAKIYDYDLETPEEWSCSGISSALTYYFPCKVCMSMTAFKTVKFILKAFLTFIGNKGYIKNSEELIETVIECIPRMLEKAVDPSCWGMAKSFMYR